MFPAEGAGLSQLLRHKRIISNVTHDWQHLLLQQNFTVVLALNVHSWLDQQEAQLSQRDRATLRVTEYFAKSVKVIQNDTIEYGVCKSLLVFN